MRHVLRLFALIKPYRALAALALLVLAAVVAMDLAIPRLVQRILDEGVARGDRGAVLRTAVEMLGISALSAVFAIGNNFFSVRVGEGVARDLREKLFLRIQTLSFKELDRQKTGDLISRLTSDVAAVKLLTQVSLRIGTRAPLLMLGSIALMIRTSPRLALTIVPVLAITTALVAFFVTRMEPLFALVQKKLDAVNNVLFENIAGARLVKALVRADHEAERFEVANDEMAGRSVEVMKLASSMTPALSACVNGGVVTVIWLGGLASVRGELSLGQIVAFTNYLLTTMGPLVMMTMLSNTWAQGLASMRRIGEVLDAEADVVDADDAASIAPAAAREVRFEDVSFAYEVGGGEAALAGVSLRAERGKTVAILGATGAGKSTLINLVPRFYDVTDGAVFVGGRDVRKLSQASLLALVGLVPQESILFSGTVRENIRYGRPDASDAEVEQAARAAEAHEFVTRMPGGYDAKVEQRGANLSGGQRQRLAIARALLVDPAILILDDATSAVDVETETSIQRALAEKRADRVTFVVAQRVSTVLDADAIVVLDKGRVVASGTHRELLESSDVYREIYDSQLGARPKDDASEEP